MKLKYRVQTSSRKASCPYEFNIFYFDDKMCLMRLKEHHDKQHHPIVSSGRLSREVRTAIANLLKEDSTKDATYIRNHYLPHYFSEKLKFIGNFNIDMLRKRTYSNKYIPSMSQTQVMIDTIHQKEMAIFQEAAELDSSSSLFKDLILQKNDINTDQGWICSALKPEQSGAEQTLMLCYALL